MQDHHRGVLFLHQEVTMATGSHPLSTPQVGSPAAMGSILVQQRVTMQDDFGNVLPVGSRGLCVKQPDIGDEVRFIIGGDGLRPGYLILNIPVQFTHVPNSRRNFRLDPEAQFGFRNANRQISQEQTR